MTKTRMSQKAAEILGETRNVYMDEDRAKELADRIIDELCDDLIEEQISTHSCHR